MGAKARVVQTVDMARDDRDRGRGGIERGDQCICIDEVEGVHEGGAGMERRMVKGHDDGRALGAFSQGAREKGEALVAQTPAMFAFDQRVEPDHPGFPDRGRPVDATRPGHRRQVGESRAQGGAQIVISRYDMKRQAEPVEPRPRQGIAGRVALVGDVARDDGGIKWREARQGGHEARHGGLEDRRGFQHARQFASGRQKVQVAEVQDAGQWSLLPGAGSGPILAPIAAGRKTRFGGLFPPRVSCQVRAAASERGDRMTDASEIFQRYEAISARLPGARAGGEVREIGSLLDITEDIDAFVFDAFGVLNLGDTPIPGAAARLEALGAAGKAVRILSNAASYDHGHAVAKFKRLGVTVSPDEIVTSRDATLAALDTRLWGCIAAADDALSDIVPPHLRLSDDEARFDRAEGFLFLSSADWSTAGQARLTQSLLRRPRPVLIANADLAAPRDHGLSLEPGHFGHMLIDAGVEQVRFFGKPFAEVFDLVEATLPGVPRDRIAMCGDTLHTDILGAAARGWRTVFVTGDGMPKGLDTDALIAASGIRPDWRLARI